MKLSRCIVLTGIGLIFGTLMIVESLGPTLVGSNDFAPFYAGAVLVGSGELYNLEANYNVAREVLGDAHPSWRYIRPPFHAVLLSPLRFLDYQSAYLVWVLLRVAAVVAFILLWRIPSRLDSLVFTALNLPIVTAFVVGQDTMVLLVFLALAVRLNDADRPFFAGAVLSLCAMKFHLFLLLPLMMFRQKRTQMLQGLLAGGGGLAAISFLAAGWNWPIDWFAAAMDSNVTPPEGMVGLFALLRSLPYGQALAGAEALVLSALAWRVFPRLDFAGGLAVVAISGILMGYHSYMQDCSILLPGAKTLYAYSQSGWGKASAAWLLTPPVYLAFGSGEMLTLLAKLTLAVFFAAWIAHAWRQPALHDQSQSREPASAAMA